MCASWSRARHACWLAALSSSLAAAGCAPYALVEPKRVAVSDLYTVEPQVQWSAVERGKLASWTVDGFPLEAVRFFRGLDDGEPLIEQQRGGPKSPPFRAQMTPSEVMELLVDSWTASGYQQVKASNLRPRNFGSLEGFAFDMAYLLGNGLEAQGMVAGAIAKGKLHLIVYTGTRRHYFPKYRDHVERLVDSIRIQ